MDPGRGDRGRGDPVPGRADGRDQSWPSDRPAPPPKRGAAAGRQGPARRDRPQHLTHQRPGQHGARPHGQPARTGARGAERDQVGVKGSTRGAPHDADGTAPRRRRRPPLARPRARPPSRAHRAHPGRWSHRRGRGHRTGAAVAHRRASGRVPHHPGVADQRRASRRAGPGNSAADLRRRGRPRRDRRRRESPLRRGLRDRDRERDHGHAGTRRRPRGRPVRRVPPGRRVPGQRTASGQAGAMIRVLIADDQTLGRAGFTALLDARDDIEVVGAAADGAGAVDLARKLRPDVILMDIRMPGLDGLEATRQIAADPELADVHIVILTTFGLDEYLFDALRFGASGFLVKDTEPADLATAVRVVAHGDSLISPSMTRKLVAEFASRAKEPHPAAELDAITQREREVMTLVADGLTNDEIARKLYMSPATVRTHVSRAMTKLGVRDRAQLVVLAYETGLVRPNWLT